MDLSVPAPASVASLQWAQRLVRINTVSRESNLPLIECIADHLRTLQVPLRLTYDEQRRKANLFATLGAGKPDGVILSGHTDTVPWDGQAWTRDPLGAALEGDAKLYGRGSADMKGFIGLVVAQTERFLAADLPHAIHYAFSYDEEVGCFGVQHLIADLRDADIAPRLCIVGEPTGMVPAIAHKGVYRWRCCVKGKPAHSSLTPRAVNAIEAGARLVAHIAAMGDAWRDGPERYEGFDVPFSTACVGVIEGGVSDNIVPEDCRFHYEFRNLPGSDAMAMQQRVREAAAQLEVAMKAVDPATGIAFEDICAIPSFLARDGDAAVQLAQRLAGERRTTLVAFGTEAGHFHRAGISTVVCGPGFIEQAHQPDEFVSLDQLARCEAFLQRLAAPPPYS
jgi:acetylornithine deacetylase